MFIIESDEIDKLYLPAHSNHRHNVHKQLRCICTQCYRGVTHQGQHVVIYTRGGGNYSRGEGSYTSPELPGCPGKKILETTWNGRVINHIIHHVTYKTIMLKKLVNCYYVRKTKKFSGK